jgi:DNA-binding MarR family transcriptional regulator
VGDPNGGTELERLVVQLLRVVSPAAAESAPATTDPGHAAAPAPELSVSASEGRALVELLAAHGIAQGELAGLLGLEKSTVSRLATGLERKGWISRGRDEGNQRYVRLYLTPAGAAIAARLLDTWQSRQARIIASLTEAERAGLTAGLGGLLRGLVAEGILGTGRTGQAAERVADHAEGRAGPAPHAATAPQDRAARVRRDPARVERRVQFEQPQAKLGEAEHLLPGAAKEFDVAAGEPGPDRHEPVAIDQPGVVDAGLPPG